MKFPVHLALSALIFGWFSPAAAQATGDSIRSRLAKVDGSEKISQSQCEAGAFDYSSRFPPEGNQGAQGQCFAFAAAGLLDEHACASADKGACGGAPCVCGSTHFSEIDIARNYPDKPGNAATGAINIMDPSWDRDFFNLGNNNQGGLEFELLEAALLYGVCEAKHAPWFPVIEKACQGYDDRSGCVIESLKRQYRKYAAAREGGEYNYYDHCYLDQQSGTPLPAEQQRRLEKIVDRTGAYLAPQLELGLDLREAIEGARDEYDFIRLALTPPSCIENRITLSGTQWTEEWTNDIDWLKHDRRKDSDGSVTTTQRVVEKTHESLHSNPERFEHLASRVRSTGRSVALGLCSRSADVKQRSRSDNPSDGAHCGPHALIANGLRWNPEKNRCEIRLRNSWGPKARLDGWLPVEPVLNSTFRISGITPGNAR